MTTRHLALGMASATLACLPLAANAQTATNIGNYESLTGLFRVGVQVSNTQTNSQQVTTASLAFDQDRIENIANFLDPTVLASRFGTAYNQLSAVSSVIDLRGVSAFATYAANSRALTIRIPAFDEAGAPYTLVYSGLTRQDSYNQFDAAFDDIDSPEVQRLLRLLLRAQARYSPSDPVAGNPGSLQSTLARSSLDLSSGDSAVEQSAGGANTAGDPWIVGASYASGSSGRFDVTRIDGRIARGFRIGEGSRGMLKIDLPFSYSRISGSPSYSGQIGMGYEAVVLAQRWSLEPRVSYGVTASPRLGSFGNIVQGTVGSRYLINGLGRGRLVIGNMVGYSKTLGVPFTGYNLNPGLKNWVFRNGVAYEMPLKMRATGRMISVRGSYNYTVYAGDTLYNNHFHEATVSIGLRGREESIRATRDLIRFNFSTVLAKGYRTFSGGVGFRF